MSENAKNVISGNWRFLQKPDKYHLEEVNENKSIFKIEPLERGFGVTLGNSLRRIMLSTLYGASITAVKIDGVDHEFSTIDGVFEDVVDIALNIKKIILRYGSNERKRLKLSVAGPCTVTAGMIEEDPAVEIINKDHVICHVTQEIKLDMEFIVAIGNGYSTAEENNFKDLPFGFITVDSIFSPVKNVTFKVEDSRVGSNTEYDKLFLEVETDGSLNPTLALSLAAKVMQEQLDIFSNFTEEENTETEEDEEVLPFNPKLLKKVDELELSVRSQNCLRNDNTLYMGDLVTKSESDMLRTPNFGRKSLNELKEVLESMGLRFGMNVPEWPPENVEELAEKYEDSH